jgi:hypothetical protein
MGGGQHGGSLPLPRLIRGQGRGVGLSSYLFDVVRTVASFGRGDRLLGVWVAGVQGLWQGWAGAPGGRTGAFAFESGVPAAPLAAARRAATGPDMPSVWSRRRRGRSNPPRSQRFWSRKGGRRRNSGRRWATAVAAGGRENRSQFHPILLARRPPR